MSGKIEITGNGTAAVADLVTGDRSGLKRPNGIVTYSVDYDYEVNAPRYATNDTYGNDMAQNGSDQISASDGVHNGIDSVLWTASAESGTWTFNSTAQAYAGTRSVDATSTVHNSSALFTRGSAINVATYDQFAGAIYLAAWSTSGTKNIEVEVLLGGVVISTTINLADYINTNLTGQWQEFSIPLEDLAISSSTMDGVRFRTIDVGAGPPPDYYLDSLQWEQLSSGGIVYSYGPGRNEIYRAYGISWTLVDNYTSASPTSNARGLSYNKFGALTQLTNGIQTRRIQYNNILFQNTTRNHAEIINGPGGKVVEHWDDGTNVYTKFYNAFAAPVELSGSQLDRFEFIVRDDLSSLIQFDIRLDGALVTKQNGNRL